MNGNTFNEWFVNILPSLKKNAVVVMDNTPYHSVKTNTIPNMSWNKQKIIEWLENKGNIVKDSDKLVKSQLMDEVELFRYLVTGQRYTDLYFSYRLGTATIGGIIKEVCTNVWDLFHEECLSMPSTQEGWLKIAAGFENVANFPNCIGSIDGKHVRIICPGHSGSLFSNYKKYYSIVLLAMCDSDYQFTYINAGSCGTDSDSTVFKGSTLFKKINNGDIMLPSPKPLSNATEPLPYMIIGDSAFGISNKVLRPYARSNLTTKKKIFNYRMSRARRYIVYIWNNE